MDVLSSIAAFSNFAFPLGTMPSQWSNPFFHSHTMKCAFINPEPSRFCALIASLFSLEKVPSSALKPHKLLRYALFSVETFSIGPIGVQREGCLDECSWCKGVPRTGQHPLRTRVRRVCSQRPWCNRAGFYGPGRIQ